MHFHFRKHAEFLKLEFPVVVNVLHVILKLIIRAVVYFNFLSIVMALVREADSSCLIVGRRDPGGIMGSRRYDIKNRYY